jgi:adenylosuccinate lyase
MSLSPLDDRYANKVVELNSIFSEFGLMRARTIVEAQWLIFLNEKKITPTIDTKKLLSLIKNFKETEYQAIKKIEATTNHDVKAVEIFLRNYVSQNAWSWIHFGCTSEDINNTAYALLFQEGMNVVLENLDTVMDDLSKKSQDWKSVSMLSRTHGQAATPTTVGKEFLVFVSRLEQISAHWDELPYPAKFSGATGTFSAHMTAFPDIDWIEYSREFVEEKLHLTWNPITTQIEPHDGQALVLSELCLVTNILIDLCRDVWGYISLGYFGQKVIKGEVGSSTMPHKVNPIDFENAEGNFLLMRGIARTLSDELPISRWQRDLTDSTLQRNFGLVFGHFLLGLKSLLKGLKKLELRQDRLIDDLKSAPEVLTEAVQTVLRAHGQADAYDQLKKFSRGKALSLPKIRTFIDSTDLSEPEKKKLKNLTPEMYTGLAEKLVEMFTQK